MMVIYNGMLLCHRKAENGLKPQPGKLPSTHQYDDSHHYYIALVEIIFIEQKGASYAQ
jgi:hypothetical protein